MSGSQTQSALLVRLRDGADALAWSEFSDRYWRLIFSFARGRGCSDQTAEDVVQDVMLVVFKQREVFRYDRALGGFKAWLGTVVRNTVAQRRRGPATASAAAAGISKMTCRQWPPVTLSPMRPGKLRLKTRCWARCWTWFAEK